MLNKISFRKSKKGKSPQFIGKPLIRTPRYIPRIGFLEGNFGKSFLKEYNKIVEEDYGENSNLKVLKYENGVVKGSNPFAFILANKILNQKGLGVATLAELEKAQRSSDFNLEGTYEDTGLVLTNDLGIFYIKNMPIARDIGEQVREKRETFSSQNPFMIPLTELELEKRNNDYGLTFRLKKDSEIHYAPIFGYHEDEGSHMKRFYSADVNKETGIAKQDHTEMASRKVHLSATGFSRLVLDINLDLDTFLQNLGQSTNKGRIVVVDPKGALPTYKK